MMNICQNSLNLSLSHYKKDYIKLLKTSKNILNLDILYFNKNDNKKIDFQITHLKGKTST